MKVGDRHYRSIWLDEASGEVRIIDQRWLPHDFRVETLDTLPEFATAIRDMWVRGAPLIGATAAYGIAKVMARDASDASLAHAYDVLHETRPTAINLRWALDEMRTALRPLPPADRAAAAFAKAARISDEDVETNRMIGVHGLSIIREIAAGVEPPPPGGYAEIPDRREAIEAALAWAGTGDTIVIAGKGHETYQIIAGQVLPFDDRSVARRALSGTGARPR